MERELLSRETFGKKIIKIHISSRNFKNLKDTDVSIFFF